MRVIAGQAKGKTLQRVPGKGTRPIADRVKESLFNILAWRIPECRFLDLFAGTGSVGIEALSRGAEEVVFVEKAAKAIKVIRVEDPCPLAHLYVVQVGPDDLVTACLE